MQVRTEELYDTLRGFKRIQETDRVDFDCARCGACCKLYENILLKPFDIFKLSKRLSLAPADFVEGYCELLQDAHSKLPVVKFRKTSGHSGTCPFLRGKKCSVYDARPTSCTLYPLIRIIDPETGGGAYYLPPDMCDKGHSPIPLSEWLGLNKIDGDEESAALWYGWMRDAAQGIAEIFSADSVLPPESKYAFFQFLFAALYLKYDTGADFTEQFNSNRELIGSMTEIYLVDVLMNTLTEGDE